MKYIFKAFFQTSTASVIYLVMALLTNKVIATVVGPVGTGIYSSWANFVMAGVSVATCFGATAIVQGASSREKEDRREFLHTTFRIILISTILVVLLLNILAVPVTRVLLKEVTPQSVLATRFLSIHIILQAFVTFFISLLSIEKKYWQMALVSIIAGICNFSFSWMISKAMLGGELGKASLFYIATYLGGFLTGVFFIARNRLSHFFSFRFAGIKKVYATAFFRVAVINIYYVILQQFYFLLILRKTIVYKQSLFELGVFSLVWNIQMSYVGIVLSSFSAYYLPTFASLSNVEEKRIFISNMFFVSVLLIVPVCVGLAVLKPFAISLMGSREYYGGLNMMRWMIIGDFLKIAVWVFGTVSIASADIKNSILLETLWYVLFSISLFFYNSNADTEVLGIGFMVAYLLMFAANSIYVKNKIGYVLPAKLLYLFSAGAMLVITASVITWNDQQVSWLKTLIFSFLALSFVVYGVGMNRVREFIKNLGLRVLKGK
jgi:O-antigen/teichoic acid export membrane protein